MTLRRIVGGILVALALASSVAGCGDDDGGEQSSAANDVPAVELTGDATRGRGVWTEAGCNACHTLAAANAKGTVGPNLDRAQPSFELVATRVTLGQRAMPTYRGLLSNQQIADVAEFVATAAGEPPGQ
jgi:mono/diheme cytochrome c family protein